jgi:HEAT repeat protein
MVASTCSGQTNQDVASLFAKLCQPSTTDHAASEIARVAQKDSGARQYIVERLPGMLKRTETDRVWLNAVSLAGELRAEETIPDLQKALSLGKVGGPHVATFTTEMRLDDDIVAKALSQMGDAAIPVARDLLASQATKDRRRAVLILRNMGTPAAHRVLQDHLPIETDPANRDLIESWLRSPKQN